VARVEPGFSAWRCHVPDAANGRSKRATKCRRYLFGAEQKAPLTTVPLISRRSGSTCSEAMSLPIALPPALTRTDPRDPAGNIIRIAPARADAVSSASIARAPEFSRTR
jgi:hypothetical protein